MARRTPNRIDRITRLISESAIGESGAGALVCVQKLARTWSGRNYRADRGWSRAASVHPVLTVDGLF